MPKLLPAYLFLGPEQGQKDEAIRELRLQARSQHPGGLDEHRFQAGEDPIERILGALENAALFAEGVFVTLAQAENLRADESRALAAYLKHPNPSAVLVITSVEYRIDTHLQSAIPKEAQRTFYEMFENHKRSWVLTYFRNRGYSIEPEALDFFLEMVGGTTDQMQSEAERLLLFHPAGQPIDLEVLENYLQHQKEESPFSLFEALLHLRLDQALKIANKILLTGDGQVTGLMILLARQWRSLYQFRCGLDAGIPEETLITELKLTKRQASQFRKSADVLTIDHVRAIYRLTHRYDLRLRQARSEEKKLLLDLYVFQAVEKRGLTEEPMRSLPLL